MHTVSLLQLARYSLVAHKPVRSASSLQRWLALVLPPVWYWLAQHNSKPAAHRKLNFKQREREVHLPGPTRAKVLHDDLSHIKMFAPAWRWRLAAARAKSEVSKLSPLPHQVFQVGSTTFSLGLLHLLLHLSPVFTLPQHSISLHGTPHHTTACTSASASAASCSRCARLFAASCSSTDRPEAGASAASDESALANSSALRFRLSRCGVTNLYTQ
jgi:hypothetical protein